MFDIVALSQCFQPFVAATTVRQFSKIILALLAMTGRVTMLGISRWAGQGGSYRPVQRFFSTVLPWAQLFWVFFHQHLHHADHVYILAGDWEVARLRRFPRTRHLPKLLVQFASFSPNSPGSSSARMVNLTTGDSAAAG